MNNTSTIRNKSIDSMKWSFLSQFASKLFIPLSNIVLARILVPEDFGAIAAITMIISFAELVSESGFSKYLIQANFDSKKELYSSANVAFVSNIVLSFFLWLTIYFFRDSFATLVGNPNLGFPLFIASSQLLLTSFSSVQKSIYRRNFNFKSLFKIDLIASMIPFMVTVPLAMLGYGFWAIIIGQLTIQIIYAVLLTKLSVWKPRLYYSITLFYKMIFFSFWSLVEAITIWITIWIDTFFLGSYMNQYYLGIFKTSTSIVNSIQNVITTAVKPVLFSGMSRLQDDLYSLKTFYISSQNLLSLILFPMGVGIFIYRDMITKILLGEQWVEASLSIGLWALSGSIVMSLGYFATEVYRSLGKPKISVVAQSINLLTLIPSIFLSISFGFEVFIIVRSIFRVQIVLIHLIILNRLISLKIVDVIKNIFWYAISSVLMGVFGIFLLGISDNIFIQLLMIIACVIFYFSLILLNRKTRTIFINLTIISMKEIRKIFSKKRRGEV